MATFHVKAIKPPNFRVDEVRQAILSALHAEGRLQVKMLKPTVQYWQGEKPKFTHEIGFAKGDAVLMVGPSGSLMGVQKWVWIDEGTKSHWVYPKRAKLLRFRVGGKPGSQPKTLVTAPAVAGNQWRASKGVYVKGIKARQWSLMVQTERYRPFFEAMNTALEKGLKKANLLP